MSSGISVMPSVPLTFNSPAHSAPAVAANAFAIDIVLENTGDGRPPAVISAAVLLFASFLPEAHMHWNLSMTCFIRDDGPEKYTGVAIISMSQLLTASYMMCISSFIGHVPVAAQDPQPLQCDILSSCGLISEIRASGIADAAMPQSFAVMLPLLALPAIKRTFMHTDVRTHIIDFQV
jgi:hypothetical protein